MKQLKSVIDNKSDFEDFVYERFEGASIYLNGKTILFIGGFFVFEEAHEEQDMDGFGIGTTVEKKYCTIEKVRRKLLLKEQKEENFEYLDRYDEDKTIAQIVLLYGA